MEGTKAGTKGVFSKVHERQKIIINTTPIFTAMVRGHGKNHGLSPTFQNSGTPKMPLWQRISNHISYILCSILHTKREILKLSVSKTGKESAHKHDLLSNYLKTI